MARQYAVTISRFNEEDEQEELVDRYITADQAIDLMLQVQALEDEVIEVEEEPENETNEEEEVELEELNPKPNPLSTGRRASYDKAALIADVKANVLNTAELAEKYRVGTGIIYQVRNKLKKDAVPEAEEPGETEYARKQRERSMTPAPDINLDGEIKLLFIQGFSLSEVGDMYPTVPLDRLSKLKSDARA